MITSILIWILEQVGAHYWAGLVRSRQMTVAQREAQDFQKPLPKPDDVIDGL